MTGDHVGTKRKLPWRRMYQDVNISNLLCSSDKTSTSFGGSSLTDLRKSEAAFKLLISPRLNQKSYLEKDKSHYNGHGLPHKKENNFDLKSCNGAPRDTTRFNDVNPVFTNGLSQRNGETTEIFSSNTFFHRFLHAPVPTSSNIESESSTKATSSSSSWMERNNETIINGDRDRALQRRRKSRADRRHTVSGATTVSIDEIENWLLDAKGHQKNYSDDDVSLVVPQLRIVRTKLALTRSNVSQARNMSSWAEREMLSALPQRKEEETREVKSNGQQGEEGHRYSCARQSSSNNQAHCDSTKAGSERRNILSLGINNRRNCFLSPRPYSRYVTTRSSVTWKSSETIMEEQLKTDQNLVNGNRGKDQLIDSSDENEPGHLIENCRKDSKRDSMYDTFLDLSKLDLSEDSGECQEVGSDAHESDNLISTDQGESEAECNATKNSSNEPHPADGCDSPSKQCLVDGKLIKNVYGTTEESLPSEHTPNGVAMLPDIKTTSRDNREISISKVALESDERMSTHDVKVNGDLLPVSQSEDPPSQKHPQEHVGELKIVNHSHREVSDAEINCHDETLSQVPETGNVNGDSVDEILKEKNAAPSKNLPIPVNGSVLADDTVETSSTENDGCSSEGDGKADIAETNSAYLDDTRSHLEAKQLHVETPSEQCGVNGSFKGSEASQDVISSTLEDNQLQHDAQHQKILFSDLKASSIEEPSTASSADGEPKINPTLPIHSSDAIEHKQESDFVSEDTADSQDENSSCDDGDVSSNDVENVALSPAHAFRKTLSLDRRMFPPSNLQRPGRRKAHVKQVQSQKKNKSRDTVSTTVNHSGIQRLYQIAVSIVTKDSPDFMKVHDVMDVIEGKGIRLSDPRLRQTFHNIETEPDGVETPLSFEVFSKICEPCFPFIRNVLLSQLSIPVFTVFKLRMERIFEQVKSCLLQDKTEAPVNVDPHSNYNAIMRLHKQEGTEVSMAVCTVDGQRLTFGDAVTPHPLNSCASVFNYCLACRQNGLESTSLRIGRNAKPNEKDDFSFDGNGKVWNPFTKAGSFLTCSMLFRQMAPEKRIDALHNFYNSLNGNEALCCDNLSYNYRRNFAHEEISLAFYLSHKGMLHRGAAAELTDILEFYFQALSTAMTSDTCAVGAATLASSGICPLTGEVVLNKAIASHVMGLLRSASPRSPDVTRRSDLLCSWDENGSMMFIVPGVLGMTCFTQCRSADVTKQIVSCITKELSENFNFTVYKSLQDRHSTTKDR